MTRHSFPDDITTISLRLAEPASGGWRADGILAELLLGGTVGPSALLLHRRLLLCLRLADPVVVEIDDLAASFGLRRDRTLRSLARLADFRLLEVCGDALVVHDRIPAPSPRAYGRLTPSVRRLIQLASTSGGRLEPAGPSMHRALPTLRELGAGTMTPEELSTLVTWAHDIALHAEELRLLQLERRHRLLEQIADRPTVGYYLHPSPERSGDGARR